MEELTSSACEPVFVVGMNGSGTSMMLDSLGRHPELYAMPDETLMMPYIIMRAERFGDLRVNARFRRYWQFAINQIPALIRFNNGVKPSLPPNWASFPRTVEGVFDGIFSTLAAPHGKRRWCEKTPDHVQHLPLLSSHFPSARFIHLVRDGREVARSIRRRQLRTPELVIYRWKKLVELGQRDGGKLGSRYLELRYEDLTSNPRHEMETVCQFLGIDFNEQVLRSKMPESPERKHLPSGSLGVIAPNPAKWPQYFDTETIKRLEAIGGRKLSSLGYPVTDPTGDADPSFIKRHWWRAVDYCRLRKRMKTKARYRSWRKRAEYVYFSVKQYGSKKY